MRERRKVILERSPESQGQRTSTQRGGQVAPRRRKAPHCREDLGSSAAEVGKKARIIAMLKGGEWTMQNHNASTRPEAVGGVGPNFDSSAGGHEREPQITHPPPAPRPSR